MTSIFKRVSPSGKGLSFDQYKEIIEKIFVEVNRLKGHELKKKLS